VSEPERKRVYLVREAFEWTYGDQPLAVKSPALWAFATREEAVACRERLKRSCRHVNPFGWPPRPLAEVTSLTDKAFRKRMLRLGLPVPDDDDWRNWWWRAAGRGYSALPVEQLARVWDALDRAEPYSIEEQDVAPLPAAVPRTLYVVQRLTWQYNDSWHDLGNDEPLRAFRDRARAEAYRWEREQPEREQRGSPLRVGGPLERCTTLTEDELRESLRRFGVVSPVTWQDDLDYWDSDQWDDLRQRVLSLFHRAWDLFDRVRFFEVLEVEAEGEQA
jgi:hypothetical protein